jgi:hypothetical protein
MAALGLADFERDTDVAGVHWEHFVTAVGIFVYMQETFPIVADVALAFNATPEAVREAAEDHPWLFVSGDDSDPTKQTIETDGE